MGLIERPGTAAASSAKKVREQVAWMAGALRLSLSNIHAEVKKTGRVALAAELGTENAAELLSVYGKARATLVAAGETVEDLPA